MGEIAVTAEQAREALLKALRDAAAVGDAQACVGFGEALVSLKRLEAPARRPLPAGY